MRNDLRLGIIGWGYWGPEIARNLDALPYVRVSMVADLDPRRLDAVTMKQPWLTTTTDFHAVLDADIDGVIIATPACTHYGLAREALLHGKHVLVEKPLTTSVAEAEALVALAQRMKRTLMVGHTFVYNPAVNELRNLIQSGHCGKIYAVETQRVNLGLFRDDIDVLWDLAPHDISILLYLFDQTPRCVNIRAHAHLQNHMYDTAHLDLLFAPALTAHIHVSWLHPCKMRRVTIIGDTRMVVYDDTIPSAMIKIYDRGVDVHAEMVSYRYGSTTIPHIAWVEPLRLECEDFVHAIATGEAPRADGEAGLAVVRVLEAARKALLTQPPQDDESVALC